MNKLLYSLVALLLGTGFGMAQDHLNCGSQEKMNAMWAENPQLEKDWKKSFMVNAEKDGDDSTVFIIPIVFHILHEYGSENISDAQVIDQVAILNRDYRLLNNDTSAVVRAFKEIYGDVKIEFRLAKIDPYGNCTNGIEHVYTHLTNNGDDFCKINQWFRPHYLNVWVVKSIGSAGVAGYAYYPNATNNQGFPIDGVIILNNYIGSIGTSNPFSSRALTHEIGHWLSLPHCWGSTNDPTVACGDDGIADTPETKGHDNCVNVHDHTCDDHTIASGYYNFADVTTTSGTTDTTETQSQFNTANELRLEFGSFSANGVSANSTTDGEFNFNNWGVGAADGETTYSNLTGAIDVNQYYEFSLTNDISQAYTLSNISFNVGRDVDGPRTYALRSSKNGFATNIASTLVPSDPNQSDNAGVIFIKNDVTTLPSRINFSLPAGTFANLDDVITFRVYAFNAENTAGAFKIDSLVVNGGYGTVENVQNYMEYSYCSVMFTKDQISQMRAVLQLTDGHRNELITASTHAATGIDQVNPSPCIPIADFFTANTSPCVGTSVTFKDASSNATVDTYQWIFPDATPSTSNLQNPVVVFNSQGAKTITLIVSNATGSDTITKTQYIKVFNNFADYTGPKQFNLNDANSHPEWFRVENPENNWARFAIDPTVGKNGNGCFKLNNYKAIPVNTPVYSLDYYYYPQLGESKDILITPSFDLRYSTGVTFSFDYSYASNANTIADITEEVKVFYSRNCGGLWTQLGGGAGTLTGATLLSGGFASNSDFAPTSDNQWANKSWNFNPSSSDDKVIFKIQFTASDKSSNLYIDNININATGGAAGLNDFAVNNDLIISPNPVVSGNALNVAYTAQNEPVTFILRNLQGEEVMRTIKNETNQYVSFNLEIGTQLPASYYFLEVKSLSATTVKKIVVVKQ